MIYSFRNDYSSIAHKDILKRLVELSDNQYVGYGEDEQKQMKEREKEEKIQ